MSVFILGNTFKGVLSSQCLCELIRYHRLSSSQSLHDCDDMMSFNGSNHHVLSQIIITRLAVNMRKLLHLTTLLQCLTVSQKQLLSIKQAKRKERLATFGHKIFNRIMLQSDIVRVVVNFLLLQLY